MRLHQYTAMGAERDLNPCTAGALGYPGSVMETLPAAAGRTCIWTLLALILAGCATPQLRDLRHDPGALPPRAELDAVPFFPQERYQCGPAALATALSAAGAQVTPDGLRPAVYLPGRRGSLQAELLAASRRQGVVPYQLEPELRAVLREVAAGRPVVVLQNLGISWAPVWHYAVVVGYDLRAEHLVLRSGTVRRRIVPLSTFERTWRRGGHWAAVFLPPPELPATARAQPYVRAVAGLEKAGKWRAARDGYRAALRRWPHDLGAGMGLGNALYALGDRRGAAEAFEAVIRRHPDAAEAYNNLAHVLAEMGDLQAAARAARRAVALGGRHGPVYARTLEGIRQRLDDAAQ